jgi:hypothetical protein
MSVFTSSPYSYILGDLIRVQVTAKNNNGLGSTSLPNSSGITAMVIP